MLTLVLGVARDEKDEFAVDARHLVGVESGPLARRCNQSGRREAKLETEGDCGSASAARARPRGSHQRRPTAGDRVDAAAYAVDLRQEMTGRQLLQLRERRPASPADFGRRRPNEIERGETTRAARSRAGKESQAGDTKIPSCDNTRARPVGGSRRRGRGHDNQSAAARQAGGRSWMPTRPGPPP